jgi:hypothetical protein
LYAVGNMTIKRTFDESDQKLFFLFRRKALLTHFFSQILFYTNIIAS